MHRPAGQLLHPFQRLNPSHKCNPDPLICYLIPSDRYEQILKVVNGDYDGLSSITINAILAKVKEIETLIGRSFQRPFSLAFQPTQLTD